MDFSAPAPTIRIEELVISFSFLIKSELRDEFFKVFALQFIIGAKGVPSYGAYAN
jgi:hypothetical protein